MTEMLPFTVEAVAKPVYNEDGWCPLRRVTDLVLKLVGVEVVSTCVRPAEPDDRGPLLLSPEAERQHKWAESVPLLAP